MPPPLIILGLDAADPDLLVRWAQAGDLPTIAGLMARGCWGWTGGPQLIIEHGVWFSLITGVSRSRHGFYYLRQPVPGTYNVRPVTARDFDFPPFWSVPGARGQRVAVVDVPDMKPVPGLPGLQLADWAVHSAQNEAAAEPRELLRDVAASFGPQDVIDEVVHSYLELDRGLYRRLLARVDKKGALCRRLVASGDFDLIFVAFGECHTATHQFWEYANAPGAAGGSGELAQATCEIYQATDRQLGLLLAQLPAGANVIVLASVGFKDLYPTGGLSEAFCRQLGYQAAPQAGPPSYRPLDLARRVLPVAWREALSRWLPRARREKLLADQFLAGTDWSRTAAYALPTNFATMIRVNLRGREPRGTVSAGAEYETVLQQLEADLRQLVDPSTQEAAIERIDRSIDLFGGGPPAALPDLFVAWKAAPFFRERVVHPRAELRQRRPEFYRSTDHNFRGFMAAAGPQIAAHGQLANPVEVLDLAPTFLALMGEAIPAHMTGHVGEWIGKG